MDVASLTPYLASSEHIDWHSETVQQQSKVLTRGLTTDTDKARAYFTFVRDDIAHSWDYQRNPVTCKASDVLHHKTGYCYAKSHLLAALLRAAGIPAGLCYQRLTIGNTPPFCLHGLNAVYLKGTSIKPELPLAFRAFQDQGGFATSGWLPAE